MISAVHILLLLKACVQFYDFKRTRLPFSETRKKFQFNSFICTRTCSLPREVLLQSFLSSVSLLTPFLCLKSFKVNSMQFKRKVEKNIFHLLHILLQTRTKAHFNIKYLKIMRNFFPSPDSPSQEECKSQYNAKLFFKCLSQVGIIFP